MYSKIKLKWLKVSWECLQNTHARKSSSCDNFKGQLVNKKQSKERHPRTAACLNHNDRSSIWRALEFFELVLGGDPRLGPALIQIYD